jgi:hypothetical protein
MANQTSARLKGDDYQHLYAWWFVLELLVPKEKVRCVTIEDAFAGLMDDVTIQHEDDTSIPDEFHQVKFHVDQRDRYSTNSLINPTKPGETSLLRKFWNSWKLLRSQNPNRPIKLYLVSNWSWDYKDKLCSLIDGYDNSIKEEFLSASHQTDIGKLRKKWQDALGANDAEFAVFIRSLRLQLGFYSAQDLEKRVAERMDHLHLRSDTAALHIATGIVRGWIKTGTQALSREDVERALRAHQLYLPEASEQCVVIYLLTIQTQKFEIAPDYEIDWRNYFIGETNKRSHQIKDPAYWNSVLLPELQALGARINEETACRLIRVRGQSRLSAWFAFGYCFSEVARYTIEVDQNGSLWRTDAIATPDFQVVTGGSDHLLDGEILDGEGDTVAVGISVIGSLDDDVRTFLSERKEKVGSLLLRPNRELGKCLQSAGDVVALADGVKKLTRAFVKRWKARRLLVFYFGPLSGACFLGHRFNAVCQEVQIMEYQQPGYAPSFILNVSIG